MLCALLLLLLGADLLKKEIAAAMDASLIGTVVAFITAAVGAVADTGAVVFALTATGGSAVIAGSVAADDDVELTFFFSFLFFLLQTPLLLLSLLPCLPSSPSPPLSPVSLSALVRMLLCCSVVTVGSSSDAKRREQWAVRRVW